MAKLLEILQALIDGAAPWQISLAIVFGLVIGLTPLWSVHNAVLFILALVINLHLGTMILSAGIFFGVSFALDPMFHAMGEAVLTAGFLQGLWATLYGIDFVRLTRFNNTIVMGSLVFSLVLAGPAFFLFTHIVKRLRGVLAMTGKIPVVNIFLSMSEEEEKASLFRWQGVVVLFLVVGLNAIFFMFLLDPLLKMALEKTASDAFRTTVTAESVETTIPSAIQVKHLQMANRKNPKKNDVELKSMKMEVRPGLIFERKLVVVEMSVDEVQFGTDRAEEAGPRDGWGKINVSADLPDFGAFKFKSPKDILKIEKLPSVVYYNETLAELRGLEKKWRDRIKELQNLYQQRKTELQQIQRKAKNLKTPQQAKDLVVEANEYQKNIQADINRIKKWQEELKEDQKKVEGVLEKGRSLVQKDLEYLKKKYSMAGEKFELARLLFENAIQDRIKTILHFYDKIDGLAKKMAGAFRPRGPGRDVHYAKRVNYPHFLIEEGRMSVHLLGARLAGKLKNFSDSEGQKVYGQPASLTIEGRQKDEVKRYDHFAVTAIWDRTQKERQDAVDVQVAALKMDDFKAFSGIEVKDVLIDVGGRIRVQAEDRIDGELKIHFTRVKFAQTKKAEDDFTRLLFDSLSQVEKFQLMVTLGGTVGEVKTSISSDLNRVVSQALKDKISSKNANFSRNMESALKGEVQDEEKEMGEAKNYMGGVDGQLVQEKNNFSDLSRQANEYTSTEGLMKKMGIGGDLKKGLEGGLPKKFGW